MIVNASQLRKDVYRLLDRVLATGQPLEVIRNGRLLRIVPATGASRLDRVPVKADLVTGDPGDLADLDWTDTWRP